MWGGAGPDPLVIGQGPPVQRNRLSGPPRVLVGEGEVVPGGQGVGVVQARVRSRCRPGSARAAGSPRRPGPRPGRRGRGCSGRSGALTVSRRRGRPARAFPAPRPSRIGGCPRSLLRLSSAFPLKDPDLHFQVEPAASLGQAGRGDPTVILRCGHSSRLLTIAALIRSRACRSAVSGRPTRIIPTSPFAISASTSTRCPVTPIRATEYVRASGTLPHSPDVLDGNPPVPS